MYQILSKSYINFKGFILVVLFAQMTIIHADSHQSSHQNKPQNSKDNDIQNIIKDYRLKTSPTALTEYSNWEKPKRIVVRVDSDERLKWFQDAVPGVTLVGAINSAEAMAAIENADGLMGFCDDELIRKSTQLRWIQTYYVGVDRCISDLMKERNIILSNGQRLSGPNIAEHAIAMMTSLTRGLDAYQIRQQQGQWARDVLPGEHTIWELDGRTLLVVGLGGIGTQVAKRGHGLGMKVIATRNSRREGPEYVSYVGLSNELLELAKQADVVINALPLTASTTAIFNKEFFDAMPNHAYFISIGRGKSTVTDDLMSALKSGEVAGAGLDVTDPEPLPNDHPLWTMPRVIITPHVAWRSEKYVARRWLIMRENLRRYVSGEALLSEVDLIKQY